MTKKKRNPADLTPRNVRAAKGREAKLAARIAGLEARVVEVEKHKSFCEACVERILANYRPPETSVGTFVGRRSPKRKAK